MKAMMSKFRLSLLALLIFCFAPTLFGQSLVYDRTLESKAETIFSFSVMPDQFTYKDRDGVFKKTFRDGKHTNSPYILTLGGDYLFLNSWFDLGLEGNFSIGYNRGRGLFGDDGSESETRFIVWFLPLDFGLYAELSLGWFALAFSGGPSVVGLIQNRSDFSNEDDRKTIRQFGVGYYALGKVKINLGRIFPRMAFHLFESYSATRMSLDLTIRQNSYNNFANDDVSIEGTSYGAGFSFDFM